MRFGLLSDIGEITPNIFAKLDRLSRAKIFIALYNSGVESELKIPLSYAKFLNFKEIFEADRRREFYRSFRNSPKSGGGRSPDFGCKYG